MTFNEFSVQVDPSLRAEINGDTLTVYNRNNQAFFLPLSLITKVLEHFLLRQNAIVSFIEQHVDYRNTDDVWTYREKIFRDVFATFFTGDEFSAAVALARSQTKPFMYALSKYVGWKISNTASSIRDPLLLDENSLNEFFQISNDSLSPTKIFKRICSFCAEYQRTTQAINQNDERALNVVKDLGEFGDWLLGQMPKPNVPITIRYSKGIGWFPRVPYICLLPPGQDVANGVYVSICFGREGGGAVAGFAESVKLRRGLNVVQRSLARPLSIDVDGPGEDTKYNDSYENPMEFPVDQFNEQQFIVHVTRSLQRCLSFLELTDAVIFGHNQVSSFSQELRKLNFNVTGQVPPQFVAALATKPFLILTGNSGTGKTKLAELFAQWLGYSAGTNMALVPVGADWTDNRNVLGFVNHIRDCTDEEGNAKPLYQATEILRLLLEASRPENQKRPYFLILDEMNLSHVERYFADFLSALESRLGELHLHKEGCKLPRTKGGVADVPETLAMPRNVFIIGTVNVDETTYMFSPKVLDRANVIEFRVSPDTAAEFLENGAKALAEIDPAPAGYAEAFFELSARARGLNGSAPLTLAGPPETIPEHAKNGLGKAKQVLSDLFKIMQARRQEFAFRTLAEIARYLSVDFELVEDKDTWEWQLPMDAQILQKILPKLHGPKRKLGPLLSSLAKYCERGQLTESEKVMQTDGAADAYDIGPGKRLMDPMFPNSYEKLCDMIESLRRDQFVSFIQ